MSVKAEGKLLRRDVEEAGNRLACRRVEKLTLPAPRFGNHGVSFLKLQPGSAPFFFGSLPLISLPAAAAARGDADYMMDQSVGSAGCAVRYSMQCHHRLQSALQLVRCRYCCCLLMLLLLLQCKRKKCEEEGKKGRREEEEKEDGHFWTVAVDRRTNLSLNNAWSGETSSNV